MASAKHNIRLPLLALSLFLCVSLLIFHVVIYFTEKVKTRPRSLNAQHTHARTDTHNLTVAMTKAQRNSM